MRECKLEGCKETFSLKSSRKYCWRHTGLTPAQLQYEKDKIARADINCTRCGQPVSPDECFRSAPKTLCVICLAEEG
jgi:hypothetical protein